MGVMRALGRSGDEEVRWDPKTGVGLKESMRFFAEKRIQGMHAYLIDPRTGEGVEEIKTFRPEAEEIMFTKQLIGG